MRLFTLPPVRRAVPFRRGKASLRASMEQFFGERQITLYTSGTAALAQAMVHCAARHAASSPEVMIPAYGCPDLVAAALQAGVYPRLVDVAPDRWGFDPKCLESSFSPNTVAVVAVNLLGLGDGATELLPFCRERNISLIQDSAQFLPRETIAWPGKYVILSFGRGKPLNLLHGGALIEPPGSRLASSDRFALPPFKQRLLGSRAAALAFNVLTLPLPYRILSSLPGTGLGDVRYHPLQEATRLPTKAWEQVGTAFELYCRQPSYRRDIWSPAVAAWEEFDIRELHGPDAHLPAEPLRLALLASDRPSRDQFVNYLNRLGLGASRLYDRELPQIEGIPPIVRTQGPFRGASALAGRLFTLPTHRLVTGSGVNSALGLRRFLLR